jgi:hypothetical protein
MTTEPSSWIGITEAGRASTSRTAKSKFRRNRPGGPNVVFQTPTDIKKGGSSVSLLYIILIIVLVLLLLGFFSRGRW